MVEGRQWPPAKDIKRNLGVCKVHWKLLLSSTMPVDSCDQALVCSNSWSLTIYNSWGMSITERKLIFSLLSIMNLITAQHSKNNIWRLVVSSSRKHYCSYHQLEQAGNMMRTEGICEKAVRVFHYTRPLETCRLGGGEWEGSLRHIPANPHDQIPTFTVFRFFPLTFSSNNQGILLHLQISLKERWWAEHKKKLEDSSRS